jgi:hypothetical protein
MFQKSSSTWVEFEIMLYLRKNECNSKLKFNFQAMLVLMVIDAFTLPHSRIHLNT